MTDQDDDIEEYLDPELDPMPSESEGMFPPLFSTGGVVVGLFFLASGALLPVAWVAVQNQSYRQAAVYSTLSALLIAAGLAVGKMVHRKTGE